MLIVFSRRISFWHFLPSSNTIQFHFYPLPILCAYPLFHFAFLIPKHESLKTRITTNLPYFLCSSVFHCFLYYCISESVTLVYQSPCVCRPTFSTSICRQIAVRPTGKCFSNHLCQSHLKNSQLIQYRKCWCSLLRPPELWHPASRASERWGAGSRGALGTWCRGREQALRLQVQVVCWFEQRFVQVPTSLGATNAEMGCRWGAACVGSCFQASSGELHCLPWACFRQAPGGASGGPAVIRGAQLSLPAAGVVPVAISSAATAFCHLSALQISLQTSYLQICKAGNLLELYFEGMLTDHMHHLYQWSVDSESPE